MYSHLLANQRFFDRSQILQGGQEDMAIFWTTDIFDELA